MSRSALFQEEFEGLAFFESEGNEENGSPPLFSPDDRGETSGDATANDSGEVVSDAREAGDWWCMRWPFGEERRQTSRQPRSPTAHLFAAYISNRNLSRSNLRSLGYAHPHRLSSRYLLKL
ncbi:hypothetical protein CXB51_007437 [Gossypium anomalum]|uniref:Uncharacterized protein n=1 Tax=Gossypium anomalum TaxID=47600 RepID=A0A8J5ZC93_9ROSI|nr:hypothetical protein CXB51_007437 [Gossypium anomalum]